ncbi:hypothetical protein AMTR_s00048p00097370 [Amborella trichopoda]|uniref:Uncharacterized protein n=1 Tax=Amborella trichopoda TaxID=13333 RepID=U5CZF2_AMBTC|nr:hypothetical protein AMTR_s00048p00097370 [Amborella trichopoda]
MVLGQPLPLSVQLQVGKDTFVIKVVVDDGLVRFYPEKEALPSDIVVEGLQIGLVAKVVKSGLSCNGGDAQYKETTQNLHVIGNLDGHFTANYSRELPCIETMGINTSGVVPASCPPIAVAGTISRMLDETLLGEEPADVKGKAVPMQNSNLDTAKAGFTNLVVSQMGWVGILWKATPLCTWHFPPVQGQPPKSRARFDSLVIIPFTVMVVDSEEEDLVLAFGDQKLPAQIERELEDDGSFDSNIALAIYDVVDSLRVIPHLEASPLRLLGGRSVTDDSLSEIEVFESNPADIDPEEPKVAAMVSDMGMNFNIPIRMLFDEVKHIKKARWTVESRQILLRAMWGGVRKPNRQQGL